jgi:AraC-type DNA-binding domain-containing proteins
MSFPIGIQSSSNADLNMYQCGTQNCEPGHDHGPAVRDHYLIHFAYAGKGKFCIGNNVYHLHKGQGFLICPGIITYYQADFEDPWSYSWVGFNGLKAEAYLKEANLSMESPILNFKEVDILKKCIDDMIMVKSSQKAREIRLMGLLYLFLAHLIEENGSGESIELSENRKEMYLRQAIQYIEMNYSRKLIISDIAHHTGLDRSYLGSIFKQQFNTSLQDFLINFRINKACDLMHDENLSIGDISRSVGYEDQLLFSKIFRKLKSLPPREYRKIYIKKQNVQAGKNKYDCSCM